MKTKKWNIDINHFTGRYIGTEFSNSRRIPLDKILVKYSTYNTNKLKNRLLKLGILKEKCVLCGIENIWNNKKLTLQLDHKNGIHTDHRLENLRILCPNCHSQTKNYSGKNINKNNHKEE